MKQTFYLRHSEARQRAVDAVRDAPEGWKVTVSEPTRTLDQNAAQWPILEAFSEQIQWPVNGQMVRMTPEEWKDVLTAAFNRSHVRLAAALDGGGVVMLGEHTSRMPKSRFSEWLEFLNATAVERGVNIERDRDEPDPR